MVGLKGLWLRIGLALAALGLLAAAAAPAVGREPRAHGERLVAEYRLPPETIARYAALALGAAFDAGPERGDSRFADRLPWVGSAQPSGSGRNPYTLVFMVSGAARAAGPVVAQWQAGWEVHESPLASREVLMAVPAIKRTAIAPGQSITLRANSAPISFRNERPIAPMLGLVQTRNLDISEVQVQVWSGIAPTAWPTIQRPSSALLLASAACLLAWLALAYWRHTVAERPPIDEASRPASVGREVPEPPVTDLGDLPPEALAPLNPSHRYRVQSALQEVLTAGLSVPAEFDESRPQRPRRSRDAA